MEDCIEIVDKSGNPVDMINELEFVNGFLWANIFLKNHIIKIDPVSGTVVD